VTRPLTAGPMVELSDATLVVFVSDVHMGGDPGADLFESHDELAALFVELGAHPGPVELVLAGDIFDLLRVGEIPPGEDRASVTLARPEYAALVEAWRSFAAGQDRRVVYLPGNHDVEVWWNPDVQRTLQRAGLVHEFSLTYGARYRSAPDRLIFSEHGNQLDESNARKDYDDPSESPLGDHVVTDLIRPISPRAHLTRGIPLRDLSNVHPLALVPEWLAGRLFYLLLGRVVTYVLLPLLATVAVAYALVYVVATARGEIPDAAVVDAVFATIGLLVAVLLVAFVLAFAVLRRLLHRSIEFIAPHLAGINEEMASLERVQQLKDLNALLPNRSDVTYRDLDVFVWGHSHAPSLTLVEHRQDDIGIAASCGCWLRQLHPIRAHFGAPPVFLSRFVLTHVRVVRSPNGLRAELWEHVRHANQRLMWIERLAVLGRLSPMTDPVGPRVMSTATIPAETPKNR